jgi:hypothetical protein
MHRRHLATIALPLLLGFPCAAETQTFGEVWNDSRTVDLVQRGIERRSTEVVDTALQTYRADARGYVYFLLDAPELDRQTLVRTDQVAVEVYWRAPNQVRQRIVGLREQRELPITRLYYYLDRLTVVQDNYGQAIVIADGDNVNDVPHPVGFGAERFYDYRLTDSLTLRLPSVPEPVRVHEVQVRPKDPDQPAVVGSIFLEVATGALVRMSFTFTPSAYLDPRLDFINVTLENGLWQGRFWLPFEQRLEIRREMPELDLPFGTLIRTRMRIGDYRFNEELPEILFAGSNPITIAPRAQRESFAFEREIDAEWRLEGIGQPMEVAELRREAQMLLRERAVSGLPRARLAVPSLSDVFRYGRADGVTLGFGWGARTLPGVATRLHAGWAFGADQPTGRIDVTAGDRARYSGSAYVNRVGDVGGLPFGSRAFNTLGSLLFARDWTDPYYGTGASMTVRHTLPGPWSARITGRAERQRSAFLTSDFALFGDREDFRPVRPIDPGDHVSVELGVRRDLPAVAGGWWGEGRLTLGGLDTPRGPAPAEPGSPTDPPSGSIDPAATSGTVLRFARLDLEAGRSWTASQRRARVDLTTRFGGATGDLPRQELTLLGGHGTLPGYRHRAFAGDRYALATALASADVARPWLRGRLLGGLGWSGSGDAASPAAQLWGAPATGTVRPSVGAGFGLFYDLLHLDIARGLGSGGRTQIIVEFQQAFWRFL